MAVMTSLNKAYARIEAGDMIGAFGLLENLLEKDPVNIEAWEAYMQICGTIEELDYVCERMLQVTEMNRTDREAILDYYYFLRQRLKVPGGSGMPQKMITFELVDQFTYTLKDKSLGLSGNRKMVDIEEGITKFLRTAIFVPYIVLFAIGLNLLFTGKNFSYWMMMAIALSVFIGAWKFAVHFVESNRKSTSNKVENKITNIE